MPEDQRKWMRSAGQASSIGLVLVIATVIGYAIGNWLDKKLGTAPWLMFVFTLLGIIAGFVQIFRIANQLSKEE
jgi:ATP synthase protein I